MISQLRVPPTSVKSITQLLAVMPYIQLILVQILTLLTMLTAKPSLSTTATWTTTYPQQITLTVTSLASPTRPVLSGGSTIQTLPTTSATFANLAIYSMNRPASVSPIQIAIETPIESAFSHTTAQPATITAGKNSTVSEAITCHSVDAATLALSLSEKKTCFRALTERVETVL